MTKDLPIDPNIVQLGSPNVQEAFAAIQTLKNSGTAALPQLMRALEGEDLSIRTMAAVVLGELGSKASSSLPQLVLLLKEDNEQLQMAAALAMVRIGMDSIPHLVKAISAERNQEPRAWFWAAWALSFLDPTQIVQETVLHLIKVREAGQSPIQTLAAEEAISKVIAGKLKE
jgi:HEAT repeat protein